MQNILGGQTFEGPIQTQQDLDNVRTMEDLIKKHVESIGRMKEELKAIREQFEDSYNNNPTYREASEKAKEHSKSKAQIKAEILKQPSVTQLNQKMKDLRFDVREQQRTLSELLINYRQVTGATQLELFNGVIGDIVLSAKITKGVRG